MPNITIYFTNGNAEKLEKEENKSGLINRLLTNYYAATIGLRDARNAMELKNELIEGLGGVDDRSVGSPVKPRKGYSFSKNDSGVVTSVIGDLKAAEDDGIDVGKKEKLCKTHGLPAMANGKCLQKGCKK